MSWQPELEELRKRHADAEALGGAESVKRHHEQGRLTVRERIGALLDPGSFQEVGKLTGTAAYDADGKLAKVTPAPYVMGLGKIDGRPIAIGGSLTVFHGRSWSNSWNTMTRSGPGRVIVLPFRRIEPSTGRM